MSIYDHSLGSHGTRAARHSVVLLALHWWDITNKPNNKHGSEKDETMNYYDQLPTSGAQAIVLGGKMQAGLTQYEQPLDIKQITAVEMQAGTDSFVAADKGFNDARSAQQTAYDLFHGDDDALTAWLTKARAVLVTFFGLGWSTQWAQAGYINGSTAVPSTISDRLALALRVTAFFAAKPSFEAASLGVTAAIATVLRTATVTSQQAVAAAATDLKQKAATRETAFNTLISKMRLLIGVLGELLNADDPRWLAFGLQIPASLVTPGQPQGPNRVG